MSEAKKKFIEFKNILKHLKTINHEKREQNKGKAYNELVKKGFFTTGNGVWHYIDREFPYYIQFSHYSYLHEVHINNGKRGLFDLYKFQYREPQWINKLLNQVDILLKEFHEKKKN